MNLHYEKSTFLGVIHWAKPGDKLLPRLIIQII